MFYPYAHIARNHLRSRMLTRFSLPPSRGRGRSRQPAVLRPPPRRAAVPLGPNIARALTTRGSPRAQELQPARSCRRRLVEEAPACREQSRARDQVPSAFGRREVCSHGAERAGVCASEKNAPLALPHEPSQSASPLHFPCAARNHLQHRRPRGSEGDAAKSAAA